MACTRVGSPLASSTIATDTDTNGEKFAVGTGTKNIIGIMKVSSRTDGTYTLKIEHSHDGTNYETLKAGSGVTTDDTVYVLYNEAKDGPCLSNIRVTVTSASTTTGATVEASVYHDA